MSLSSSFSKFVKDIPALAASLVQSVLAVFQAFFALGADIITSIYRLGQHFVAMTYDLFQGLRANTLAANIVAIGVLGVGYYIYTQTQAQRRLRAGAGEKR
ncbi:hypothetical protein LshimejAT787_0306790 [Lyophyllum shimeji]|uniref:Uncharacterized protein n=1 Tax=Lyophyllum shimeji TaxID=47721 RepID=A0A9P3PJ75_LYOSH|nr:hypothetical protein LshimejAT787_0306790 [Lyophyllum shimeji]